MAKKVKKTPVKKKTPAKKATTKKAPTKKAPAKKAPAKKAVAKKAVKKTAAKTATRAAPTKKKTAAPKKKAVGGSPAKKKAAKKANGVGATTKAKKKTLTAKTSKGAKEASRLGEKARTLLGSRLNRDKNATPILFSIDDATALLETRKKENLKEEAAPASSAPVASARPTKKVTELADKPEKKRVHAAASLADILGFDPAKKKSETELEENTIPAKWKKYYRLLIELRQHVKEELDLHTADTLKHSFRDDSGDLSGYGLHQADAGTDNFDRDFALSLVSNEQDALHEVEEAIQRIKLGSYGVCEVTGKKIDAKRLSAVPFTRFSVEGQSEYEKNKRRKVDRSSGTAFAESGDLPALNSDDGDE